MEIDGKRFRRYTPVADVAKSVAFSAKWDYRPGTHYGGNSLNTQISADCALSAEDEYFNAIEVNVEDVFKLVHSLDAEHIFYLYLYVQDATTREMAEKLGVSQSTAVRRLNKAKRALRVAANVDEHEWAPYLLEVRHFGARTPQQY